MPIQHVLATGSQSMPVIHAIILGIVQGLSEFLPISSSGHLIAVPFVLKTMGFSHWDYQGKTFDVALHAGTAIAMVVYFWNDWMQILRNGLSGKASVTAAPAAEVPIAEAQLSATTPSLTATAAAIPAAGAPAAGSASLQTVDVQQYPRNILWQILLATVPAGILGLALDKLLEKYIQSPLVIAINLAVFGVILWLVDKKSKSDVTPGLLNYRTSFLIGLSQAIALIPGISRSGITLTAARLMGLPRETAARFSFLLATPTIIGACVVKLKDMKGEHADPAFWLGIAASLVFGLLSIKFLLNYLKKSDFTLFLWWRVGVAAVVLYFVFVSMHH